MSVIGSSITSSTSRCASLELLIREAETWQHRRAAQSARDRGCYRIGAALEPEDGHLLDDIAITGLDSLGAAGVVLLAQVALTNPHASLSGLLRLLFASPAGVAIRSRGTWARWNWLHKLYIAETSAFLESEKGQDPEARWRREKPSAAQIYIIKEIARALAVVAPALSTRGMAFDWILAQGGNPRFYSSPPLPAMPLYSREEKL